MKNLQADIHWLSIVGVLGHPVSAALSSDIFVKSIIQDLNLISIVPKHIVGSSLEGYTHPGATMTAARLMPGCVRYGHRNYGELDD